MKILTLLLILTTVFSISSCLHTMPHKVFEGEKPQICINAFDTPPSHYADANKLDGYTVEELIALDKCGKEYSPQINLDLKIINHRTYPVPALLEQLKKEPSDEFKFYIINILAGTPDLRLNDYKYDEQFKKDRKEIIAGVSDAVSKMKDGEYKKSSARKLFIMKKYFDENP